MMRLIKPALLRLALAGALTAIATPALAFDSYIDFDQLSDLSLFDYLKNENATLGFVAPNADPFANAGAGGLGGGVFQAPSALVGEEKHVIAVLPTAFDNTQTSLWDASVLVKYSQLTESQPAGSDYSTTIKLAFATSKTLPAGVLTKDFLKNTFSFQASFKFEHALNKSQPAYLGLDMANNLGGSSQAANRLKQDPDPDTWYKLELTVTRSETTANGFNLQAFMYDVGDGTQTPVLLQQQASQLYVNATFSGATSVYSILQFDGETTSAGPASETFVDEYRVHTVTVPEPAAAVLLIVPGSLLLARRRRSPGTSASL